MNYTKYKFIIETVNISQSVPTLFNFQSKHEFEYYP